RLDWPLSMDNPSDLAKNFRAYLRGVVVGGAAGAETPPHTRKGVPTSATSLRTCDTSKINNLRGRLRISAASPRDIRTFNKINDLCGRLRKSASSPHHLRGISACFAMQYNQDTQAGFQQTLPLDMSDRL